MKSLLLLWKMLANESADRCCTSATHDIKTVMARTKHEGLSFLTITLPEFGKAVEISLDQGRVCPHLFPAFAGDRGGLLPRFLGGYLGRVFDSNSGVLLDEPCIDSILALRQLTLMFGKVSIPCSDARVRKAIRGFVECEQEVKVNDSTRSAFDYARFKSMSSMLYARVFTGVDRQVYHNELLPKHGPGVTADKLLGNQKWNQQTWTTRLEEYFPAGEMLLPNWRYYDQLEGIDFLEPEAETPVKVVTVPKTLKTPRIIAIEPTAMQYAQQSLDKAIRDSISHEEIILGSRRVPGFLRDMLGFDDQTPNQRLAMEGSITGSLATLDLSEASDRVSNELVSTMLSNHPFLDGAVAASRSTRARVPGYGVIPLSKFASMGSALCFPMEAMVFLTTVLLGIEEVLGTPLSLRDIYTLKDKVRIYGDDIIVPVDYVDSVVRSLEAFGFRVNVRKSFWNGKFRESCGREYYNGSDISIVRVRHMFPSQRSDATEVISLVSLRNQLYFAGYWRTCQWLDDEIRKVIRYFPVVLPSSPVQGRHSFLGFETQKLDEDSHAPLVKGWVNSSRIPSNKLDDTGALLKFFLKRGDLPSHSEDHLERSGRPSVVNIKLRYASAV